MKNYFQKKDRKAFTIVELVIVIAVIAILAAVLIPTFSNIIKRSQISADTQLCRNLNTVLTMATSEGRVPGSMYDVLYLVSESGYLLGNLNPTAEGYYFAWDTVGQKIVYIREDLDTIIYPEDYTIDKSKCWITVGNKEEAERVAAAGYNLYLENNIDLIELHNVAVSIDTGAYKLGSLVVDGQVADQKAVVLSGNFGTTTLNASNTTFSTTGSISSLNVGSNTAALNINGNVASLSSSISNTTMSQTGAIGSITSGSVTNSQGTTFTSSSGSVSGAVDGVITVGSKEDIENIRTQIKNGRDFAGETIKIPNDINMAGIAFQPISNFDRDHKAAADIKSWFKGTLDGQGNTIKNFSTNGFAIAGLNAGTNDSSVSFNGTTYNEAVYGLLGTVYVPEGETVTIKNLTIDTAIDMVIDDANQYVGDSVGALIGFVYGAGTLNIENVTINGAVNGFDGVSAFIGRAYGLSKTKKLTINYKNCTNNATVTGIRKTGGFLGSGGTTNNCDITFTNCVNNGDITCQAKAKEIEIGGPGAGSGYYLAGAGLYNDAVTAGITNNGKVKVG
jgi:prepilin-type N-terminal cleavage/methylation domain-containing protein